MQKSSISECVTSILFRLYQIQGKNAIYWHEMRAKKHAQIQAGSDLRFLQVLSLGYVQPNIFIRRYEIPLFADM